MSGAQKDLELFLPTRNAFHREEIIGVIDTIERRTVEMNLTARIISPTDEQILNRIEKKGWNLDTSVYHGFENSRLSFRSVDQAQTESIATILVVDKSISLVLEQKDDSAIDFEKAIGLCTFSNSRSTVASYVAIFNKLWRESELRAKEEQSRKQSELLQDILAHDIRNYNQAARITAELLQEELKGNVEMEVSLATIVRAIDGSTDLVEKAKKLGRIVAEGRKALCPIDLIEVIDRSLLLVKGANPTKEVKETRSVIRKDGQVNAIEVLADDLLSEVFINIFSNCAKFTPGATVPIEILINDVVLDGTPFWRISISDTGPGVPERDKDAIFQRYVGGHKGSGLGLSIVRSLVVDRYGGRVRARNRGPVITGAVFEIDLRMAGEK